MNGMATITSKRQFTIPVEIFKRAKLRIGDKVLIQEQNGVVKIEAAAVAIERLAGSLEVPKQFRGKSYDELQELAIKDYYSEKYSK